MGRGPRWALFFLAFGVVSPFGARAQSTSVVLMLSEQRVELSDALRTALQPKDIWVDEQPRPNGATEIDRARRAVEAARSGQALGSIWVERGPRDSAIVNIVDAQRQCRRRLELPRPFGNQDPYYFAFVVAQLIAELPQYCDGLPDRAVTAPRPKPRSLFSREPTLWEELAEDSFEDEPPPRRRRRRSPSADGLFVSGAGGASYFDGPGNMYNARLQIGTTLGDRGQTAIHRASIRMFHSVVAGGNGTNDLHDGRGWYGFGPSWSVALDYETSRVVGGAHFGLFGVPSPKIHWGWLLGCNLGIGLKPSNNVAFGPRVVVEFAREVVQYSRAIAGGELFLEIGL